MSLFEKIRRKVLPNKQERAEARSSRIQKLARRVNSKEQIARSIKTERDLKARIRKAEVASRGSAERAIRKVGKSIGTSLAVRAKRVGRKRRGFKRGRKRVQAKMSKSEDNKLSKFLTS